MPSSSPVPADIVCRIASFLLADGHLRTVADLRILSTGTYETVTPILFSTLTVDGDISALSIPNIDTGATLDGREVSGHCREGEWKGIEKGYFTAQLHATRRRRIDNLRHVRHLVVNSAPTPPVLAGLKRLRLPLRCGRLLFPQLESVSLSPTVTDSLRTFSPDEYDPKSTSTPLPPLLDWLLTACRPRRLCISFPLVPSVDWAIYRDESMRGSYQLISRLSALVESESESGSPDTTRTWLGSLQELEVRDIVHQVPPSLRGVHNIYHFANHLSTLTPSFGSQSQSRSRSIPPGPLSTGMSGPEWNYRAWQISTAIKSLFPSSTTSQASEVLDTTGWTFINLAGHVLTKDDRDDQDDSGVEWREVDTLVKDLVENGLKLDLPAREGFGEGELEKLFERIKYVEGGAG